ncbi:MFS transporter [Mycolicibacterium thermoresistibile]
MTVTRPPDRPAWTPRIAAQLTVLAAAAFVYVTAEMVPVAALPAIAADFEVGAALVAALLAGYALVAAVATVPLVRLTAHWPRRRVLLVTLVCLTGSQVVSALAPDFTVLAAARMTGALTHGLMWSVIAPIGVRLVPASHAGRATTAVYVGTVLALVAGSPLTAAMSAVWGWRSAVGVITVVAAAVTLAARMILPAMRGAAGADPSGVRTRYRGNPRLVTLSVLTGVGVTGHFLSYTLIVVLIGDVVGVRGPQVAGLLAAFGIAGLIAMTALARPLDHRPRAATLGCLAALAGAFVVLLALAVGTGRGMWALAAGAAAIVVWGAASTALPPMLQAAAMRTAPEDPDGASGLYVTAFQVGIMAGSLGGGLLYDRFGPAAVVAASTVLITAAMVRLMASRGLLPERGVDQQKVTSVSAQR